jgi:hypothetical protein
MPFQSHSSDFLVPASQVFSYICHTVTFVFVAKQCQWYKNKPRAHELCRFLKLNACYSLLRPSSIFTNKTCPRSSNFFDSRLNISETLSPSVCKPRSFFLFHHFPPNISVHALPLSLSITRFMTRGSEMIHTTAAIQANYAAAMSLFFRSRILFGHGL